MAPSTASPSSATAKCLHPRRSGGRSPRRAWARTRPRRRCATALCDGDAGLWRLQREVLPNATPVLDWWHAAVRFEHALQAARSLGAGTADARLADAAVRGLERAKWRLWHGRWPGCRRRLAALRRWAGRESVREVAGIGRLRQHVVDLLGYLPRNEAALVPHGRPAPAG